MAKPVNRDFSDKIYAGMGAMLKGGLIGLAAAAAIPVIGAVAATSMGFGIGGAIVGGLIATGLAMGIGATVGLPVIGGLVGGSILLNLAGKGKQISREQEAYNEKVERRGSKRREAQLAKINDAEMHGMQQGYVMGFQEGQQHVVSGIQNAMQEHALANHTEIASAQGPGPANAVAIASASARCECGPHTKKILDREQAVALAAASAEQGQVQGRVAG